MVLWPTDSLIDSANLGLYNIFILNATLKGKLSSAWFTCSVLRQHILFHKSVLDSLLPLPRQQREHWGGVYTWFYKVPNTLKQNKWHRLSEDFLKNQECFPLWCRKASQVSDREQSWRKRKPTFFCYSPSSSNFPILKNPLQIHRRVFKSL